MSLAKRSVLISALVTSLGTWVFWWGTDGFTAFTAETARRVEILRSPRALPDVTLEDQNGKIFRLKDYQGKLLAVDFIFTRCTTLCRSMGMIFKQIRDLIPEESLGRDFALLSISFDPEHDDPASLKKYGEAYGADGEIWRIARVRDKAELQSLLDAFGIIVIPDQFGGFEHNTALHLVGRDGRLRLISDIDKAVPFAEQVVALL
ncbi:protein SCO1/2 [Nitrosospira multiformis]|uniref:Protein SCO1/2 n=1 Tax=Nitrosospira multiformis TaxID=1231 RepID=A0A1I0F811_9PROT|nr:SCO family protein [Nitrosospira multiformis]SET53572.1 protein SCO1/2 [Nitrosospira multiformis]